VECQWLRIEDGEQHIRVSSRSGDCLVIKVTFTVGRPDVSIIDQDPERHCCEPVEADTLETLKGVLPLEVSRQRATRLFPTLAHKLPLDQLAFLLATTRVVGMKCPGLYSIYSELTVNMREPDNTHIQELKWRVLKYDTRFKRVIIEAETSGAQAVITAFVRPQPQTQSSIRDVRSHITSDAFAGRNALVVGGSRGLGELCTKILAAGGADVRFTYHHGNKDAAIIEQDIRAAGGSAIAFSYDVLSPPECLDEHLGLGWIPSHVYYFATPPIFGGDKFSPDLFNTFCRYYVDGFRAVWVAIRAFSQQPLSLFYPSSVYVNNVPSNLGEYAAAKTAGEILCKYIKTTDAASRVNIARLPKLPTDQTLSVFGDEPEADPIEILIAYLKNGEG
jgi:hypothetical protein